VTPRFSQMPTLGEFVAHAKKYGVKRRLVTLELPRLGRGRLIYLWRDAAHFAELPNLRASWHARVVGRVPSAICFHAAPRSGSAGARDSTPSATWSAWLTIAQRSCNVRRSDDPPRRRGFPHPQHEQDFGVSANRAKVPDARIRVAEAWAGSGRCVLRAVLLDPAPRLDLTVPSTLATGSHGQRSGYVGFGRDSRVVS
jgi:hypothetical protein